MTLRFTIIGDPKGKKNSQTIARVNGKPMILQGKDYKEYERLALAQIPAAAKKLISTPVNVQAHYFRKRHQQVDKSNLENALLDILVRAGVLEDDNRDIVAATDGSRVYYDKENPRTEVIITDFEEEGYEVWRGSQSVKKCRCRS